MTSKPSYLTDAIAFSGVFAHAGSTNIITSAVREVLTDKGFNVPSPLAENALLCARVFMTWSVENKEDFIVFADNIILELRNTFVECAPRQGKCRAQREKMWGHYHTIRSSTNYKEMWTMLLRKFSVCTACPIFYQYYRSYFQGTY